MPNPAVLKKTKMICTMGPATDRDGVVEALIANGMNVARLNFSHGDREEHARRIARIKKARKDAGIAVAIMLDTKGPEIRTGVLKDNKVTLTEGEMVTITTDDIEGDASRISVSYKGLPGDLSVGNTILIDDGLIEMTVTEIKGEDIICRIDNGGELGSRKSMNIPGVAINLPGLTEKDEADLKFGVAQGIDFVAASFIRKPQDVIAIRKVLDRAGGEYVQIISKIESQEGVDNIQRIITVSDGVMVARGDLGVEIPAEDVPLVQKNIIQRCNIVGRPVITATQMLDSMIRNPRPTRAEVGDVANAVFDGTDAVMLSGETAAGDYPVEACQTMARIVRKTENSKTYQVRHHVTNGERTVTNAVCSAVVNMVDNLDIRAIIAATSGGYTPRMLSKYRPDCLIAAVSDNMKTVRRCCLQWGVYCIYIPKITEIEDLVSDVNRILEVMGIVKVGDLVIASAGLPFGIQGNTNTIRVRTVGNAILSGMGVGDRMVTGFARFVTPDTLDDFNEGDIVVTRVITPGIYGAIEKAAAVITSETGFNTEADHVAKDYGIPVIKGVQKATSVIEEGKLITVDPLNGMIYQGAVRNKRI
ncbi:pyruvate kinase [Pseudoramibacter alactolyticus ATCC 23263]|uniref:Pyruvate kinase n=1 Tax=Pseudoramibacter alactolyticus ATCC 23263 TaxID=887929 RepID=E6MFV3_9FIRM|nr:pyruvate kinase [Pseudoramibacter alactolyticus]EFV02098.1 pyruvate kinase [Pseudoramibacter alactolyticus ATCC 23263]